MRVIFPSVTSQPAMSHPRGLEELLHLGLAERLLDLDGFEQALHRRPQVLGDLVDDRVGADLDALALGRAPSVGERPDVEADDDRVGGRGEHDVGLVDPARGRVDHVHRTCSCGTFAISS